MSAVEADALLTIARRHFVLGITREQAVVLALAEMEGEPLDPWAFDDAAIVLRAESLLLEGLTVVEALSTARGEHATWAERST